MKNKHQRKVLFFLLSIMGSAHAISLPANLLFQYAYPIKTGALGSCTGISFVTPNIVGGDFGGFTIAFTAGSVSGSTCTSANIGTVSISDTCISEGGLTTNQANKTWCISQKGLNELSTLASAGSTASCMKLTIASYSASAAANISCVSSGNCSYTSSPGAIAQQPAPAC